jgi:hypothetical protein
MRHIASYVYADRDHAWGSPSVHRLVSITAIALAITGWAFFVRATWPAPDRLMLDFTQYYDAGRALLQQASPYHPEARQYSTAAFLLPPIYAIAMMPLAALPVYTANMIWFVLSLGFLLIGCLSVLRLTTPAGLRVRSRLTAPAAILILAVLLLPVWTGAKLGQITALLFGLSMAGLALQKTGRPVLGGMLLGIAIAFKFIPITLALFGLWLGWRRFAIAAFAIFIILQLLPAIIYPSIFIEYWTSTIYTIPAISHAVNLSLIGMARHMRGELALLWRLLAYTLSGVMVLAPFALAWKTRDLTARLFALALLVGATVTAAPLVEHHYMILLILPIWVLGCQLVQQRDMLGLGALGAIFILLSQPYRLARTFLAIVPTGWNSEAMGEVLLTLGATLLYILLLIVTVRHAKTYPRHSAV